MPKNAVRKTTVNDAPAPVDDVSAEDYANNMFRDGNNRAAGIKQERGYDKAARTAETQDEGAPYSDAEVAEILLETPEENEPETLLAMKHDTSRSRDGTEASGELDESGGFLGGTTQEVDDLEATGMPVDKIPHMND